VQHRELLLPSPWQYVSARATGTIAGSGDRILHMMAWDGIPRGDVSRAVSGEKVDATQRLARAIEPGIVESHPTPSGVLRVAGSCCSVYYYVRCRHSDTVARVYGDVDYWSVVGYQDQDGRDLPSDDDRRSLA
jgi:hypothetical protein